MVVDAVSEMSRNRSVTHVLMSPETYQRYKAGLTQQHRRAGIKNATCHAAALLTVEGMTDTFIFSFNCKRARMGENLLRAVRSEECEDALTIIDTLLDQKDKGRAKWLHVCELEEEGSDEAAGE